MSSFVFPFFASFFACLFPFELVFASSESDSDSINSTSFFLPDRLCTGLTSELCDDLPFLDFPSCSLLSTSSASFLSSCFLSLSPFAFFWTFSESSSDSMSCIFLFLLSSVFSVFSSSADNLSSSSPLGFSEMLLSSIFFPSFVFEQSFLDSTPLFFSTSSASSSATFFSSATFLSAAMSLSTSAAPTSFVAFSHFSLSPSCLSSS